MSVQLNFSEEIFEESEKEKEKKTGNLRTKTKDDIKIRTVAERETKKAKKIQNEKKTMLAGITESRSSHTQQKIVSKKFQRGVPP
jgi:hypothetical protein